MEVSLRKANAIQNNIREALSALDTNNNVYVNEFQNAVEVVTKAHADFVNSVSMRGALLDALYEIRDSVANANVGEISNRLSRVARLEKDIQFYTAFAAQKPAEDMTVINSKLEKMRNRKEDSYVYGQRGDNINVSVLTQSDIDNYKTLIANAKKAKQKLQDELLELNVRKTVVLSDATVKTLTDNNII